MSQRLICGIAIDRKSCWHMTHAFFADFVHHQRLLDLYSRSSCEQVES